MKNDRIKSKEMTILANLFIVVLLLLSSCGEGVVKVENVSYEPKISVEGFLVPGQKVKNIRILRNFKLDKPFNAATAIIDPAKTTVTLKDEQSGQTYPLSFHIPDSLQDINGYYYEYTGNDLIIGHEKTYTLEVNTEIDGQSLWTKSTTTVPSNGFKINSINANTLKFAQKSGKDFDVFELAIERAPGITFYVHTLRALNNDVEHFITNHLIAEFEKKDWEENKDEFSYRTRWTQNTPDYAGESTVRLFWVDFYFYSRYEVIVYAADKNYKEFLQTYNRVQEFDGNFHEAKFNFEGDGIGVFGSVVPDTIYIEVTK